MLSPSISADLVVDAVRHSVTSFPELSTTLVAVTIVAASAELSMADRQSMLVMVVNDFITIVLNVLIMLLCGWGGIFMACFFNW